MYTYQVEYDCTLVPIFVKLLKNSNKDVGFVILVTDEFNTDIIAFEMNQPCMFKILKIIFIGLYFS